MKFLADMGLARSTVAFLRAQGHDAVHLRDQRLQRLEDEEIIEKARAEGRVILTHDLDFGRWRGRRASATGTLAPSTSVGMAAASGLPLISRDRKIQLSGVNTIW